MKKLILFWMILGIYTEAVLGQTLTEGTSNPCNRGLDIDCYSQYSTLKKSTVHLYSCAGLSGVILNSTVPNNKLYLLTASHGISSRFLEQREGTKVYWGWERTCLAPHQSGYSALSTSSYVKLKVLDRSLDFALFEITVPPLNYTPYYAGWDCSGKTTHITHPIVIHHPQKDVKKIAFPEFTNVTRAPSSWEAICLLQQPFVSNFTANSMWEYRFTQGNGLVEPGTSGSPIFDDLNKVIGISSFHDPNSQDCIDSKMLGAKFQLIYPHIKSYLDPQQSGVLKIDGYDPSNPHADTYEGNNTIAEASTESIFPDLAIADFKGFLQSKISSLTDVDYYSLTLKNRGGFKLSLKDVNDRFKLELFEENSTQPLATSRLVDGIELLEYLYTGNLEKKVYVKVRVASGVTSLSAYPKYKLEINYKQCYDPYEANNMKTQARTVFETNQANMPRIQTLTSVISSSIDHDWYKINTEGRGRLTIRLRNYRTSYQIVFVAPDETTSSGSHETTNGEDKIIIYDYNTSQTTVSYIKVYDGDGRSDNCAEYHLSTDWQPNSTCQNVNFSVGQNNASTASASDGTIVLTRLSGLEPITYKWSNDATTRDISNLESGNYTVTATGADGCTFIHTTHISISSNGTSNAYCSGTYTLTQPSGSFSDRSGSADYINNSFCRWKIAPLHAQHITLRFSAFRLHPSDKVQIFDGSSTSAPLLAEYTGATIPAPVTSSGGTMYVRFIADGADVSEGFAASYTSVIDDGHNQIKSYSLWFDNQYDAKLTFDIAPSNTLTVQTSLPTDDLAMGLHTLHLQFNDIYNQPSSVTTDYFIKTPPVTQPNMGSYEYWFDKDFENRVGSEIAMNQTFDFQQNIDVADLANGLHAFHIRFTDNANNTSVVSTDLFIKGNAASTGLSQITKYEYWFDKDFEHKITQTVTPTENYTLISNLSTQSSSLANGLHAFHIRFTDNANHTSVVSTDLFIKAQPVSGSSQITQYQYWFDDDYETKITQNVTPTELYTLINNISTQSLLSGQHTISHRFLDNANQWSVITKDPFEVMNSALPIELVRFNAECDKGNVLVSWQTATETNNAYFELLQSTSPQSGWKVIDTIPSKSTGNQLTNYQFLVKKPSRISYYRLKQVDKDGRFHYAPTISTECAQNDHYLKVFPNPVTTDLFIETDINEGDLMIDIYNSVGQRILKKNCSSGFYPINISLSDVLAGGIYFVKVSTANSGVIGVRQIVLSR